ncbi:MAG: hypothetical protein ACLVJH_08975 [Faecalibacterium prausnitzii]
MLSALCLFTPFEEFVNNSFSIPTLVYYLTVAALFLFFTAQGVGKAPLELRGGHNDEEIGTRAQPLRNGRVFRSGLLSTAMLAAVLVLCWPCCSTYWCGPSLTKYTEFDLSEAGNLHPERQHQSTGGGAGKGCAHLLPL